MSGGVKEWLLGRRRIKCEVHLGAQVYMRQSQLRTRRKVIGRYCWGWRRKGKTAEEELLMGELHKKEPERCCECVLPCSSEKWCKRVEILRWLWTRIQANVMGRYGKVRKCLDSKEGRWGKGQTRWVWDTTETRKGYRMRKDGLQCEGGTKVLRNYVDCMFDIKL